MENRKSFVVLLLVFLSFRSLFAQSVDSLNKKSSVLELSFGQSLLFISNSRQFDIRNSAAIIVPTSAILFFGELRPEKRLSIPVFLNIATESKQFLIDGALVSEKASPTFGTGISFKPLLFNMGDETRCAVEVAPLASFVFDKRNQIRVAPVIASRLRLIRGKYFTMYCGLSYSIGIDAFGILYGTGSLF